MLPLSQLFLSVYTQSTDVKTLPSCPTFCELFVRPSSFIDLGYISFYNSSTDRYHHFSLNNSVCQLCRDSGILRFFVSIKIPVEQIFKGQFCFSIFDISFLVCWLSYGWKKVWSRALWALELHLLYHWPLHASLPPFECFLVW